ncbi:MAG: hypothetical protein KDC53_21405, partial [Saprospiraceae bacterium]|nr:hypothetical protein [Saprospiraceae bacterium]
MRNIVLTTGFIIIMRALSLSAQETPYCGFVYQSESQEPLAGVHISLDDSLYFTTGNEGQFCINTLKGQHILSFSFVAHETLVIDTILQDHTPLVILLNKKDLILPEVEVRANTKNRAEDL